MAIKRMISRDVAEFREFQTRMAEVGRIRIGQFVNPPGKNGRPVKLDRFRLTSPNADHIHAAAEEYGGVAQEYQPQGGGPKQWEVVTDSDALYVYIVNGQLIDPVYEFWAAGRTCVRRCDGEWNSVMQESCVCNAPNRPQDPRQLCKVTTRVNVMLPRVAGLNSWRLETHSENAAVEMASPAVAGFVRVAPMPVPAVLRLRHETRRPRNHEQGKFDSQDFYVPWFDISKVSAEALAIGGDAITQALTMAGSPAALGGPERFAIEARPVSAPVPPPTGAAVTGAGVDIETIRPAILADIEAQTDLDGLEAIKDKLISKGIDDKAVKDAWNSKRTAIAIVTLQQMGVEDPEGFADAVDALPVEDRRQLRQRLKAGKPCLDPYCANSPETACGFTPDEHMAAHGADAIIEADRAAGRIPDDPTQTAAPRPYRVLVTGSRTWTDVPRLSEQLDIAWMTHKGRMVLVHGKCPQGADLQAAAWAKARGVPVEEHPADWSTGKGAGFARNQAMVDTRPDIVLSFNRGGSKGTEHCTAAAEAAGLKVLRFTDHTPFEPQAPEHVPTGVPLKEYRVDDTVNVGGIEFTKFSDNPFLPGTFAHEAFADPIPDPVEGTVEAAPDRVTLPDVPAGDYDADELYTMIMIGAGQQNPPLTTAEVNGLIVRTTGMQPNRVTGHALAQLRAGLKSGAVNWR